MPLAILQGEEAEKLLRDGLFRAQWAQLFEACPWATGFQSPAFVISWHEAYHNHYSLLLLCEFTSSRELTGLLPLALENGSGRATLPGANQAEYKTWLALPGNGASFINQTLRLLREETRICSLSFRYVAPGTPLNWAEAAGERGWIGEVEQHPRAIIRIGDPAEVVAYLKEKNSLKSTKSKWNRLKRVGKIDFQHLTEPYELAAVFDELITYYEIRQEAVHGKRAFQEDPAKKAFHLALLRKPSLLHVTVMKAGDEIVSASFGIVYRNTYSLAMTMFSPAHACHSPLTLHYLLLVELLHKQGFMLLDLTAGTDAFKERFASDHDSVQVLSLYARRKLWAKQKIRQRGETFARRALHAWGIAPHTARSRLQQILRTPFRTASTALATAFPRLFRIFHYRARLKVYAIQKKYVPELKAPPLTARDRLNDLLALCPEELWRIRQIFLAESLTRLEQGWHSYTRMQEGRLLYCGWASDGQRDCMLSGMDSELEFPAGSAVLYSDYSARNSNRFECLEDTLSQMLHDAPSIADASYVFLVLKAGDPVCQSLDRGVAGWIPLGRVREPWERRAAYGTHGLETE